MEKDENSNCSKTMETCSEHFAATFFQAKAFNNEISIVFKIVLKF